MPKPSTPLEHRALGAIFIRAILGLLKTDRMELWSFREVIYDNDPDWIFDRGELDAAQTARHQWRVRWQGFHGEKSPDIGLKLLQHGFA